MSTQVYSETISLSNPYHLKEKNLLIRLYEMYPNLSGNYFFRFKLLRLIPYMISLIANIYGLIKLSKGNHTLLKATFNNKTSRNFRIRDTNSQFASMYFKAYSGCYEADVSGVIELFLKKDAVFVDIGSNWGHHSFNAVLNKTAKAILFEPNPDVFKDINRIASELNVTSAIQAHNIALSDKEGKLSLEQHYFESGVASISASFSNSLLSNNKYLKVLKWFFNISSISYTTDVKTLDSLLLPRVDLMKIDAEGVELEILKGASVTLQRLRPIIIFEFHSGDLTQLTDYNNFFDSVRYALYTLECDEIEHNKGSYMLKISSAKSLERNHQYNLLAAPVDIDFESYGRSN